MAKKKRTLSPKLRVWTEAAKAAAKEGLKPGTPDFAARQREIVEGSAPVAVPTLEDEEEGTSQTAGGGPRWRQKQSQR